MSGATVTAVTRELLETGLITMSGTLPASGRRGRPQEMLAIVPEAGAVIGGKVAEGSIRGVVVDLTGEVHEHFHVPFDASSPTVSRELADLLGTVGDGFDRLVGIGLGVPGTVVSGSDGRVTSPMLGWRGLPLGAELSERLGVPVMVGNDVNALVTGQRLYGVGRDLDDFITVTLGRGIGLGIVLDGAVRLGRGGAGEFGHTRAREEGPRCECGRRGCLEQVVSEPALLAQAIAAGIVGDDAIFDDLAALAEGDDQAAGLFAEAGRLLGDAVADLVNLLAPECVVMAGEGTANWALYRNEFEAALAHGALAFHDDVEVIVDVWADDTWGRGAAALVLGSVFDATLSDTAAGEVANRRHVTDVEAAPSQKASS